MVPGEKVSIWPTGSIGGNFVTCLRAVHDISDGTIIELSADKVGMDETVFTLLGDLATESWYKAVSQCEIQRQKRALAPSMLKDLENSAQSTLQVVAE